MLGVINKDRFTGSELGCMQVIKKIERLNLFALFHLTWPKYFAINKNISMNIATKFINFVCLSVLIGVS